MSQGIKDLKEEYEELDEALAYWGDEELHKLIKRWYLEIEKSRH